MAIIVVAIINTQPQKYKNPKNEIDNYLWEGVVQL